LVVLPFFVEKEMANLLQETVRIMEKEGLSSSEIIYIGLPNGERCTWEDYVVLANEEYGNGYGGEEVLQELVIVFLSCSVQVELHRGEYDGAEWWGVRRPFVVPDEEGRLTWLFYRDRPSEVTR
jgi:hypothetical protein